MAIGGMKQISVRELRQHASRWLRQVQEGEAFEVTDRGRPVALLVPRRQGSVLQQLIEAGRVTPPSGDLLDLGPPLKPEPGQPLPSAVLQELRADER